MRTYIGRRHGIWISSLGPNSSYRTYAGQQYFWNLYQNGTGNLAAYPGTSNHGWGVAVDIASSTQWNMVARYGSKFGWKKTEAFSEDWHYNYVGGYKRKPKKNYFKGSTKKEKAIAQKVIYHRYGMNKQVTGGKGPKYREHRKWLLHYKKLARKEMNRLYAAGKKRGFKYHNVGNRRSNLARAYNAKVKWSQL